MIVRLKKKTIFKISLIIWIITSIFFGRTTIDENIGSAAISIYSCGRILSYVLLLCTILWGRIAKREVLEVAAISAILILSAVSSGEVVLFGILLFVVAAKEIKSDEILIVYFRTHLVVLLTTIILAITHIIDTNIMNRGFVQRNSFGFSHPNAFGGEVLTVCICYVTLRWGKIKNYELFAVLGLGLYFLQAADCRMANIVLILHMLCTFLIKNIFRYNVKAITIRNIVIIIFATAIIITISMILFYSSQNQILRFIDEVLSHRFDSMHSVYRTQGFKLFGQTITDDTMVGIDNSYARVLLVNGIIPFLVLIVLSICVCFEFAKRNQIKYLLAFAATIMSGFIENSFFRIENNFCLIIGGAYLLSRYYEQRNMMIGNL